MVENVTKPQAPDTASAAALPDDGKAKGKRKTSRKRGGKVSNPSQSDSTITVLATAQPSRPQTRHYGLLVTFIVLFALPALASTFYMYFVADDQYASTVAFTVQKESTTSPSDVLGGLAQLGGASASSDSDILFEYIQSQEIVEKVNARLDLEKMFTKPNYDPVFAMKPGGTIEDLTEYWNRMVRVFYDGGTGLIELRVTAFDPQDAYEIAQEIFVESSAMINELSSIAREDAMRYAKQDLDEAIERLKSAREAVTAFRSQNQVVDPTADIQSQMGLLNTLQQQLAAALIEYDLLLEGGRSDDPRLVLAQRRIDVIEGRISEERKKFSQGFNDEKGQDYVSIVAEFERLNVDRQFAEQTYTSALALFDSARNDAQRQSRYLAAYIKPTTAQRSEYPQRLTLSLMVSGALLLFWFAGVMIYYSVRDRR